MLQLPVASTTFKDLDKRAFESGRADTKRRVASRFGATQPCIHCGLSLIANSARQLPALGAASGYPVRRSTLQRRPQWLNVGRDRRG